MLRRNVCIRILCILFLLVTVCVQQLYAAVPMPTHSATLSSSMPASDAELIATMGGIQVADQLFADLRTLLDTDQHTIAQLKRVRLLLEDLYTLLLHDDFVLHHPDFLFVLNHTLDVMRQNTGIIEVGKRDIRDHIIMLLKYIFNDPERTMLLVKGFGLFDVVDNKGADITFCDDDSRDYLANEFPRLLQILSNNEKAMRLVLFLSMVRLVHPMYYVPNNKEYQDLTPLEYAIETGTYISLGNDLYVAPLSESFRRHIIFKRTESSRVVQAVELFMQGQNDPVYLTFGQYYKGREPSVDATRFYVAQERYQKEGMRGSVKAHCLAEYPETQRVTAYGENYELNDSQMFRLIVFDHSEAVRGRRISKDATHSCNIPEEYSQRVITTMRKANDTVDATMLVRSILKQVFLITQSLLEERYILHTTRSTNHHMGNYRLALDGTLVPVGDFNNITQHDQDIPTQNVEDFTYRGYFIDNIRASLRARWIGELPDINAIASEVIVEKEGHEGMDSMEEGVVLRSQLFPAREFKGVGTQVVRMYERIKNIIVPSTESTVLQAA